MSCSRLLGAATLLVSFFSVIGLQAAPVNINSADVKILAASLNGVGAAKAKAIVEYRETNGEFKNVDELSLVEGIGEGIVLKNRDDIALNEIQLKQKLMLSAVTPALKKLIPEKE